MRKIALALAILGTTLGAALYTAPAHAQATRTWVSGVGDDANPCSRTAPCKTFAGAIAKTSAGGEIDVLDPGGFGGLTITKSITIDGGGGQVASALVAGTNGFVVAAGSNDVVIIKNMRFQGLLGNSTAPGNAGINGIRVISGGLTVIENCEIYGFNTNGVDVEPGSNTSIVQVLRSQIINNTSNGIFATATGNAVVQVYNSTIVGTFNGGPSQGGILAGTGGIVTVGNSNFQDLSYGAQVQSGGTLNVDTSLFSSTTSGIMTNSGTSAWASNNSFYSGTAFVGAGTINSAANNKIGGTASVGTTTVNSTTGYTIK